MLKNIIDAPGSTAAGATLAALFTTNAASTNNDVVFWLNVAGAIITLVAGALKGRS